MLTIRHEKPSDAAAREALLDAAYGPVRFEKPSQRLRAAARRRAGCRSSRSRTAASSAPSGCGTWRPDRHCPALLLGPLAVDPDASLPRHRLGADAPRAPGRGPARPSRRAAGRRSDVLRPLRLLGRADRSPLAAGPRRQRPPARSANFRPARSTARAARSGPRASDRGGRWLPALAQTARAASRITLTPNSWMPRGISARRVFRPSALADMTPSFWSCDSWPTTPSTPASTAPS